MKRFLLIALCSLALLGTCQPSKAGTTPQTASEYFDEGGKLYRSGENEKAVAAYNESIRLRADNEVAYLMRGAAYQNSGNLEKALADYTKAISLDPSDALAYYRRAELYKLQKKTQEETADHDKFVNYYAQLSTPSNAAAFWDRAQYYESRGFFENAIDSYTQLLAKDPSFTTGNVTPTIYEKRANLYVFYGKSAEAVSDYGKAITAQPQRIDLLNQRADVLYLDLGDATDIAKARADYSTVIGQKEHLQNTPEVLAHAYQFRGNIALDAQEYDAAIDDFNHAQLLDPKNADIYFTRGIAFDGKKDYKNALENYGKAIDLNPNNPQMYNNRGVIYTDLERLQDALNDFTKARKLSPQNPDYIFNSGLSNFYLKNYEKALADYADCIKIVPNNPYYYASRADVYAAMGKEKEQKADENKAAELMEHATK